MGKSEELKTTTDIVRVILKQDEKTRNSDSFLYLRVLDFLGKEKGVDIHSVSITTFLLKMSEWGFPAFETVRRTRQKIQQYHPELAGNTDVEAQRTVNEEAFKNYARTKAV